MNHQGRFARKIRRRPILERMELRTLMAIAIGVDPYSSSANPDVVPFNAEQIAIAPDGALWSAGLDVDVHFR